jgi:hypothetical protein
MAEPERELNELDYVKPSMTLDRVADITKPGDKPAYSIHGYIVAEDATVYAMHYRWWHGAILALLYPEQAEAFLCDNERSHNVTLDEGMSSKRLLWPATKDPGDVNVFAFQEFEFSLHRKVQVVRICPSRSGNPSFDFPRKPMSAEQITAVKAILKELGYHGSQELHTDAGVMTVRALLKDLNDGVTPGARLDDDEEDEDD